MSTRRLVCAMLIGVGATLSSQAMSEGFAGPYVDAGIGSRSTQLESTGTFSANLGPAGTQTGFSSGNGGGQASFFGSIAAGWSWNPSGPFVLGLGAFVDIGSSTVVVSSFSDVTVSTGGTFVFAGTSQAKQTNRYGISVEPGYEFTPRTVGYLKLSWNWSKYEFTDSDPTEPLASFSATFNGFGYGAGLKHMFTDNAYVFIEVQRVMYNSKSSTTATATMTATDTVQPGNTLALIGVGWQL